MVWLWLLDNEMNLGIWKLGPKKKGERNLGLREEMLEKLWEMSGTPIWNAMEAIRILYRNEQE